MNTRKFSFLAIIFLLITLHTNTGFAQVTDMTQSLLVLVQEGIVTELDGVVQSRELLSTEDGEVLEMICSFDYTSGYLFRNTINDFVRGYNDISFLKPWERSTEDRSVISAIAIVSGEHKYFVISIAYHIETGKSIFHLWNEAQEGT